jgi:hypothetical protein
VFKNSKNQKNPSTKIGIYDVFNGIFVPEYSGPSNSSSNYLSTG